MNDPYPRWSGLRDPPKLAPTARREAVSVIQSTNILARNYSQRHDGRTTSRLYLGYDWFTDVTASVAVAAAILGIVMVIDPLLPERGRRPLFGPPTSMPPAGPASSHANGRVVV